MPKLNPDNQISITHSVVSRMLGEYGIDDFVFKILDQGIENTSVRIDSAGKFYVLRVYQYGKKDDTRIELELRFQDYLREHNIPIPAVYKNQNDRELTIIDIDGKRRQIILMEFAEGESMTLHYTPRLIENLAALHTRMHLLGIEFAGKVKGESRIWTELRDRIADATPWDAFVGSEAKAFAERTQNFRHALSPDLPHGFNHLDMHLEGNILVKDEQVTAVLDFDDTAYSPPIVCLGYALWEVLSKDGPEMMRQYIAEYEKIRPLTSTEQDALPYVLLFRNYVIGVLDLTVWKDEKHFRRVCELEQKIVSSLKI